MFSGYLFKERWEIYCQITCYDLWGLEIQLGGEGRKERALSEK
jgi:hypothetical protein